MGSALRTISLRLRGTSVSILEEMGEETDGVVESVSKMQKKIQSLTGVNILTDSGAYKETYTILKEIGTVWEDMSDIDQAALLELMAGKNRANTLAAILGNMKDLDGAYESALQAEGSALKENEAYLDSIQGRIDLFTNAVQTMWMNLLDTSAIKGIVDIGTSLIKFLDSGAGRVTALSAAIAILNKVLKTSPIVTSVNGQLQIFGKNIETIKNNFVQLSEQSTGSLGKIKAGLSALFGGQTVGTIDLSGMLSESDFNEKLNGLISGFNNLDTTVSNISWDDYVKGVSESDAAMGAALKTCTEQNGVMIAGAGAYQAYTGAAAGAAVGNKAVEGSSKKATAALIGTKVAALAANAALTMGISLLISLAIKGITAWANAEKEAADAARKAVEASQEIRNQVKSLEEYKNQIEDLRSKLDANTLSEQEAYDAREKLLTIQDELINKFNLEKNGINLVTGAIENQISAIDKLAQDSAQKWINENQKSINTAVEFFNSTTKGGLLDGFWEGQNTTITNWGATESVANMIEEYANHPDRDNIGVVTISGIGQDITFSGSVEDVKSEVDDFISWIGEKQGDIEKEISKLTSLPEADQTDDVKQRIESLKSDLSQIKDVYEDIGEEYKNWFGEDSTYAANKAIIEEAQYNTALTQYADQYTKILQAQNDFKEAQLKGDEEAAAQALNTMNSTLDAASASAEENGQSYMADFFNGIKDEYSSQTKELNLSLGLINNKDIKNSLSEALSAFKGKNAKQILQDYEVDPDITGFVELNKIAEQYDMTIEELINSLVNLGYVQSGFNEKASETVKLADAYSKIVASVESFNEVEKQSHEIIHDGIAITKEHYESLKEQLSDVTVGGEDLSDAIDENNGYIVKNAQLLKKLVAQSKNAKKATINVAKAQAQLEYRDIVNQMRNAIMMMGIEYQAHNLITDATFDNISAMREQIETLKQTIQQYALLEIGLSDAANAYNEYEAAKERDAQLTYDESFLEMIKTIDEGILKNETGSEAFEYSVRAIVPEVEWEGIEDPNEKVKAIHDYIDGDPIFSKLFYVDEDSGELDITADNVREFIKLSKEAGMITGGPEGFELSDTVYGTKEWAEALGITEAAVLALLSATEDCDALWGNILTDVMTHPLDREINKSVDEVDEATKKLEDYLKLVQETNSDDDETNDVKFDSEYYNQLVSDIGAANKKLEENQQAALDNAQAYNTVQAALSSFRGDLALTDGEASNLASSLKEIEGLEDLGEVVIEDGQLKLTDEQLTLILGKLGKITEPSIVQVQLRYDEISSEIDQINEYIENNSTGSITIDGIVFTNGADADGNAIEDYLAKLTAEQKSIQLTYNITETSTEEQKSVLESYQEMAKNGVQFTVTANVTQAKDSLSAVSEEQSKINEKQEITVTAYASTAEQALKDVVDQLNKINSKTITITVNKVESSSESGPNGALGNAFAYGTIGLSQAQHDTVVGELGPEMVVDPIKGIYYTVGDNGTEMVNLPKGAIIYNHKQTAELLKNGHTTRGKYTGGLSFASGNAYASYGIPSYHPNLEAATSFANGTAINNAWDDAASTLSSAADSISDAFDDASDSVNEFEETIDWIEIRMEEFDERIGKLSAEIENLTTSTAKNAKIDEIVTENQKKYSDALAGAKYYQEYAQKYLQGMNDTLVETAQNGAIAITEFTKEQDEATVEAIQNYREYAQKAADLYQQAEEIITEIASLAKQAFDNIVDEFENKLSKNDNIIDRYDAHNAFLETDKGFESEDLYKKIIEQNLAKITLMEEERNALQTELNNRVESGQLKVNSPDWYDAINTIAEIDTEIINLKTDNEDLNDSINEINWKQFELLIKQFQAVSDEAENLLEILENSDSVDEFGNWTDEGITSLGLLAQKMEVAEKQAEKYKNGIEYLNENWEKLGYTQEEYIDRLDELKSGQYDAIKSYHDSKDAIVELNKARVDAIKDGIQKEIDAHEKLIKKQKELLEAEKDKDDFKKSVAEKEKNISEIQRKLDALEFDSSMSAAAKRKQLKAELAEAEYELQEMYSDRSYDKQQEALDKELEDFQNTKDTEMENWDKYLENVEFVVADSLAMVQENTRVVYDTLKSLGQQYGLDITESLTAPWLRGEEAIQNYGAKLNISLTELASMFGLTVDEFAAKLGLTTEMLVSNLDITVAQMAESLGLTNEQLAAKLGLTTTELSGMMDLTIQEFAANMGLTIPSLADKLGVTTAGLAGNLEMTMSQFAGKMGFTVDELAGKFGLTSAQLSEKLGMTYQDLMNPFGLSMSATVDALTELEKEYKSILDEIYDYSVKIVDEVNKAMQEYEKAEEKQTPEDTKKPVPQQEKKPQSTSVGSKINAGNARIYADSYGGGGGKQYYASDPNYIVLDENNGYVLVRHHKLSSGYTGWFKKTDLPKYASGTTSAKKDQLAILDELGEELQLIPGKSGRLEYIKKGTGIVPADITSNLMSWGELDPQDMLDRNRPQIAPSNCVVNTEIQLDCSVGTLVNIEHCDQNTLPDVEKMVNKAFDKHMQTVNNNLKRYAR